MKSKKRIGVHVQPLRLLGMVSALTVFALAVNGPVPAIAEGGSKLSAEAEATGSKVSVTGTGGSEATRLVISSWPGAYGVAQDTAIIAPFKDSTAALVEVIRRPALPTGGEASIPHGTDVIELTGGALAAACQRGDVLALGDVGLLKGPSAEDPADDFVDNSLERCGIGNFMWSTLFMVDPRDYPSKVPATLKDVFNPRSYPGKRALIKEPRRLMEMALLADGVPPADVYAVLATDAGTRRALRRLGSIQRQVVWVDKPEEGLQLLAKGDVSVAMTYSGRAFRAAVSNGYALVWDGSVREMSFWAVPKSAQNPDAARSFIRFATSPERLAAQTRIWPYGPVRRSSISMVGQHRYLPVDLRRYLPSAPENLSNGLTVHAPFWSEHNERIGKMFTSWMAGKLSVAKKSSKQVRKRTSRNRKGRRVRSRGGRRRR